jgi:hypothetical protein
MVQQRHEKLLETIRLAMLSLLGFALFCLLIVLSAPDSSLLVADPTVKMPFADVQVSFPYFLILAPFLLIIMTVYLHIFYGYWLDVETDYQHLACSREPSEPFIAQVPTLFSLDDPVSRYLTAFIFYWLVPLVLGAMAWKAAVRLTWGLYLVIFTGLVTAMLVFLQIRRCPTSQRKWNRLYWVMIVLIISCAVALTFPVMVHLLGKYTARPGDSYPDMSELIVVSGWLPRPFNIFRADLKGKWLADVTLRHAYAKLANFQGAHLRAVSLEGVNL